MSAPYDHTAPAAHPQGPPPAQYAPPAQYDQSAAPAPAPQHPNNSGPINDKDVEDWKTRFNAVLGNAGETINSKSAEDSQSWTNQFFGCCSPIDLCKNDHSVLFWMFTNKSPKA